jgi:hypothetical protein
VAISTSVHHEVAYFTAGTTSHWVRLARSTANGGQPAVYDAIEVTIASTASTGWVRRDGSTAKAATDGNVMLPAGAWSVRVPYSTKISVLASASAPCCVRGIPRSLLG